MNIEEFDQIFNIMEKSFPLEEYRTYEEQKALFEDKRYHILTHSIEDTIMGFVAYWLLDGFIFIEHLAIDPRYRNQGIGASLLSKIINFDQICILEVELPEDAVSRRRIHFYERHGFHLNAYPYIQPSLSKGRNSKPLMIMSSNHSLTESEFITIRDDLYHHVYKCI